MQASLTLNLLQSGKSAFLRATIGEMNLLTGSFRNDIQDCAYCDQSSWLQNEPIQTNIIGSDQVFDGELYKNVLWACDLEHDLSEIPEWDQAKVGSNGVSLSGGQKQRISMARALYARKELFILDDSFSALDPRTEENIAQRLLRPNGMMRANGQTVIVASNRATSEGLLPYADFIIFLNDNGIIQAQGSPEELAPLFTTHAKGMDLREDECFATNEITMLTSDPPSQIEKGKKTEKSEDKAELPKVSTFFSKFPTVWLQWWLDADPYKMTHSYAKYIGIYSLFQGASLIFTLLASFQQLRIVMPKTSRYFHSRLLKATMRFSQDMQLIDWNLPITFLNAAEVPLPTFSLHFRVFSSSYLLSRGSIFGLHGKFVLWTLRLKALSSLTSLKLSTVYTPFRPYCQRFMVQRWLNLVLDMVAAGVAILVVGLAIKFRTRSTLVGLALVNVISLNETLQLLILQWAVMEISLGSITRLEEFTAQAQAEKSPERQNEPAFPNIGRPWPPHGSIEYKNITARYQENGPNVLKSIPAGSKVGICGRTGSGKSTLISALFQMIDIKGGSIIIDGVDTASLHPEMLRSHLIGISQQSYIMPGISLRDNLGLGCPGLLNDSQLITALERVHLWDTVSERGGLSAVLDNDTLSAGQSQLLSCAQALLRPGSVVVLDEPASNLTSETADLIQRVVLEEFRERTVIVIMHQIEKLLDFDVLVVVVLEDGRVAEMGQPHELQEGEGLFRKLLDASRGRA
ncbi:P-loop containing nucleoside triphosphate hydrolase protein [Aspergillus ellipticus CBS 707.79]|uniref:P-loop containing nucleoside triphosphate hydrolase protein n=1 Tax=Aspergillus ellipticus CBS 707.79 TaxID=1448320 RepID=A0A319DB52_9EURO|nr:P-loop containing nucleoside triphosphate hydrolase protein [Aspergillus ellipticus CBS 707.79]